MDINALLRENIKNFKPYSSARDEYSGSEGVFLDANENSFGSVSAESLNRYPDPYQRELKKKIAELKQTSPEQIFLGNGSDEAIDLLFRAFCRPGRDKVMILPPTYGMYSVCAELNDIEIISVPLNVSFEIDLESVLTKANEDVKLIFICSPNNPSGNVFDKASVRTILENFNGLVVIDEAYIDFSQQAGWLGALSEFENLVVLQTFSKAWGLANARLGMVFADKRIIQILNNIKYPYNVNGLTQNTVLQALERSADKDKMVAEILAQRAVLQNGLERLNIVRDVFPSQANFLLVRFDDARNVFQKLLDQKIIVRDRSKMTRCEGCLRITVGTADENKLLIETLKNMDI